MLYGPVLLQQEPQQRIPGQPAVLRGLYWSDAPLLRQPAAVAAEIVGRLVDDDDVRLQRLDAQPETKQNRVERIPRHAGVHVVELGSWKSLPQRLPDQVRPSGFVAADLGAIRRGSA